MKTLESYIKEHINEGFDPDAYKTSDDLIKSITDLCGCGSGQDFNLLWEVLEWCDSGDARHAEGTQGCYRSAAWELAAKVLDRAELITHGTGIGWPWTEQFGKELLALRRKEGEK